MRSMQNVLIDTIVFKRGKGSKGECFQINQSVCDQLRQNQYRDDLSFILEMIHVLELKASNYEFYDGQKRILKIGNMQDDLTLQLDLSKYRYNLEMNRIKENFQATLGFWFMISIGIIMGILICVELN